MSVGKRKIFIICGSFFLIVVIGLVLVYNYNPDETNKLEKSIDEYNINKKQFGMYLENDDGEYIEHTDSELFPDSGYLFNIEKSYCVDNNDNVVENVVSYQNSKVTVASNKTIYCYLYFDIIVDTEPPTNNSVSINNGDAYTTSTSVTLTLSSTDVAEMCISNTDSCSNWEPYATSKSWTLTTGDGTKTVYVWFRDEYGNTSEYVTDTITLDTAAPTNNSVKINNNATYTTSANVTLTLSSSGASQMCISNTSSCSSWVTYATSKSHTLTTGNGTKTVYVKFRDSAGNTTSNVTDTITLDGTAPTVTARASSNNTTTPKISITSNEAGTYCVNTTSTATNFSNCILTGSISANTALTTSALSSSGKYYVHVKDAAGNVGGSSAVSITKTLCSTSDAFGACLRSAKTQGFNSTMEAGLYRYQGLNVNNYVCFGTTTKSTCTGNPRTYMYRVIGVNSSNQVKLIKNYELDGVMEWNTFNTDITWPNSIIYSNINGSSFYTNTTYVPTSWQSKIATYSWKYGDVTTTGTAAQLYASENAWTSTVSAKIAIMYGHDYAYACQSGGANCESSRDTCKNSWIHPKIINPNVKKSEWIMVRYGKGASTYYAWQVLLAGQFSWNNLSTENYVRPVFYLTTSVKYRSGSGTLSDPFIIS